MQSPETKEIGTAIGFASAFLFSSVFGMHSCPPSPLVIRQLISISFAYLFEPMFTCLLFFFSRT